MGEQNAVCGSSVILVYPHSRNIVFNSLVGPEIGDTEATALADALRVNQSLRTLRYSNMHGRST